MKKQLLLGAALLSLALLTACNSGNNNNKPKESSVSTAKSVLKKSASDLKTLLNASPKADMNQKLDSTFIPNYIGMTLDQANTIKDSLKDATFIQSLGNTIYRKDLPENTILAQSVEPGTKGHGQWVTFITSTQYENQATTTIDNAHF